jgi:hypothetical protein
MNENNSSIDNILENDCNLDQTNTQVKKAEPKKSIMDPKLKKLLRFVLTQLALVASVKVY